VKINTERRLSHHLIPRVTIPAALMIWGAIAGLDWFTTFELYLSTLYLIMVLLVTWNHGVKWGMLFAILSFANQLAIGNLLGNPFSKPIYFAVDVSNWLITYLIGVWMCIAIKVLYQRLIVRADELDQRVKERTAQLEALNRDLEDFAYTVAHDLRAPARHTAMYAQLVRDRLRSDDAKVWEYLGEVSKSTARMGRLIDDLLGLAYANRTDIEVVTASLDAVVDDARGDCVNECVGRNIDWRIGVLPSVVGDPGMLRLVFVNLLSNAIKFTSRRMYARIEIDAEPGPGDEVIVRIRDDGVGFDPQYKDKLFKVFQRLHKDSEFAGTGIGLATVRRVIERHGGRVWAESRPGHGASFFIALKKA
jgi:signal transduction histidine kinase